MIPFGLSQLMTVSLPIGRRATKCFVPGATAIYLFNEGAGTTLTDLSGNGNHGTFGAGAAAPAWTPQGISFDGGDRVAATPAPDVGPGGLTVHVVCSVAADVSQYLVSKQTTAAGTGSGWAIRKSATANGFAAYVYNGARAKITPAASVPAIGAGVWACISLVADGTAATLYADESPGTPIACVGFDPAVAQNLTLGATSYSAADPLTGGIAAVLVYPFALTPSQIAQNVAVLRSILAPRGIDIPK